MFPQYGIDHSHQQRFPPSSSSAMPHFAPTANLLFTTHSTCAPISAAPNVQTQQQQSIHQSRSRDRCDALQSMRKHRSLEGAQFLEPFLSAGGDRSRPPPPPPQSSFHSNPVSSQSKLLLQPFPLHTSSAYPLDSVTSWPSAANAADDDYDPLATSWTLYQPVSSYAVLQQIDLDPNALRREFAVLCDRFNYLAASVRTYWAPELRKERQCRREESRRVEQLEQRLRERETESQMLRAELQCRDTEEEERAQRGDSGFGSFGQTRPRDFTDHSISLHEYQTLKAKLERSELSLAERTRELQDVELRAKCAEEQKVEKERSNEILARSQNANEAQLKLLHEDLDVLRGKLELKNQQLDLRERERKKLEAELETMRTELREAEHRAQDAERKIGQLTHSIDQLEKELREREREADSFRQRLLKEPGTRTEAELQRKLENAGEDMRRMEQMVDQMRAQNESERQQQLEQFRAEREQLQANIAQLKKELADRHVLISSQSEKISQLDSAIAAISHPAEKEKGVPREDEENELERTRREMDRLLDRIRTLEREKRAGEQGGATPEVPSSFGSGAGRPGEREEDECAKELRQRIRELEEALRESVGITTEKEKALSEQRHLCEKLSAQVTELFEASGGATAARYARDAMAQLADGQRQLQEERLKAKRELDTLRKELGMALVAEKEAAIALVQSICPAPEAVLGLKERLDTLKRQKEALRHALLMRTGTETEPHEQIMTGVQVHTGGRPFSVAAMLPAQHNAGAPFTQPITIQTSGAIHNGIALPPPPSGVSAPASLAYFSNGREQVLQGINKICIRQIHQEQQQKRENNSDIEGTAHRVASVTINTESDSRTSADGGPMSFRSKRRKKLPKREKLQQQGMEIDEQQQCKRKRSDAIDVVAVSAETPSCKMDWENDEGTSAACAISVANDASSTTSNLRENTTQSDSDESGTSEYADADDEQSDWPGGGLQIDKHATLLLTDLPAENRRCSSSHHHNQLFPCDPSTKCGVLGVEVVKRIEQFLRDPAEKECLLDGINRVSEIKQLLRKQSKLAVVQIVKRGQGVTLKKM